MKKKRLFPIIMASLMSISIMTAFPMGASAVGSDYTDYSPVLITTDDLKTTSFNKYLVMDVNANVPNVTFTYTIEHGTAIEADTTAGTLEVLAGIGSPVFKSNDEANTGSNTASEAKFITGDTTYAEADANAKNDTVKFTTTDNTTDEKYAKKTLTIDFSSVQFTEPGVYRYIITESGDNQGVTNDSKTQRTLDVYVEDATTDTTAKKLKIAGYVMYSGETVPAPSATESTTTGKSSSYTNTYSTHDLTFGKEVTGNQGSKDKYFKFTVNITGAVAGTIYDVDISKANATSGTNAATLEANRGKDNPTSITVPENATSVSADFYLQDGQSIIIKGIADGTSYTITEAQEDYTPSASITGDRLQSDGTTEVALSISADKKSASVSDDGLTADTNVAFTNHRNGTIPTGIILSIAPTVIIGLALIGGIVFLIIRNKKRKYEE